MNTDRNKEIFYILAYGGDIGYIMQKYGLSFNEVSNIFKNEVERRDTLRSIS